MPVELPGLAATDDGSGTEPWSGAALGQERTLRLARVHEAHDGDRALSAHDLLPARRACHTVPFGGPSPAARAAGGAEAAGRDAERAAREGRTPTAVGE
ncbi:hypothetical protein [Streptomyces caelestis]|uniref:hypothetical protein n=1 Tax=Streptomyces caelestis TaxID=36816 RepID=UPI0036636853